MELFIIENQEQPIEFNFKEIKPEVTDDCKIEFSLHEDELIKFEKENYEN